MNNPDFEINLTNSSIENQKTYFEVDNEPVEFTIELNGGTRGLKGDTGPQGIQGIQGIQGEKGDKGDKGDVGAQGPQGEQGIQGERGEQGIQGPQGRDGYVQYTAGTGIEITEENVINVTSSNASWGHITGTLSDQTDLKNVLDLKANSSSIPTKVSDLSNDLGFIDNTVNNLTNYYTKSESYTKSEVDSLVASIPGFNVLVVQTLPTTDIDPHTIYLLAKTGSGTDIYNEYIYINNAWELIGNTQVDLTNYYTKTETDTLLNAKADTIDIPTNEHLITINKTEPTVKTGVWIKDSGNLFDKNNANVLNALIRTSSNNLYASDSERTLYIACQPNTTYRISKTTGARFRVDERENTPAINSSNINPIVMDSASEYVYTTSANGNYLILNYYTSAESGTEQDMLNSISIEVVPSINVLENNIYKEIYNKPEILFDNASGVNSNITLSKSAANYSYIEIFYKNTDDYCSSVKAINETDVSLTITYQASDKLWYTSKVVTINGISISNKNYAIGWINNSNNTGYGNINNMKITRVIGYK